MKSKTCGECKHYIAMNRCVFHNQFVDIDDYCGGYAPKPQPITNGDVIRQGGNRALKDVIFGNRCYYCAYKAENDCCSRPNSKDCPDGIEAWLNAPAESEAESEVDDE